MRKIDFPEAFITRLKHMFGEATAESILVGFEHPKKVTLRANLLRVQASEIADWIASKKIEFNRVPWCEEAFILEGVIKEDLRDEPFVREGKAYIQDLSSMLPVVVLDPRPGEDVLDFCAAPGSKTSQIAARLRGQGRLEAIEKVRDRYYQLKANCERLGAGSNVQMLCMDARRYEPRNGLFDKVLVDAPCSSEGRFNAWDKDSIAYWKPRKVDEMSKKQKGLLHKAVLSLKPGGTLVYSTCTFAPEENEQVVEWVLKKYPGRLKLQECRIPGVPGMPGFQKWEKKTFHASLQNTFRVMPNDVHSAFFIAKFMLE